jgi:hypothetical protein
MAVLTMSHGYDVHACGVDGPGRRDAQRAGRPDGDDLAIGHRHVAHEGLHKRTGRVSAEDECGKWRTSGGPGSVEKPNTLYARFLAITAVQGSGHLCAPAAVRCDSYRPNRKA